MSVDPRIIAALSSTLSDLDSKTHEAIPLSVIEKLSPITETGARLTIDLEASTQLGAPLITVQMAASTLPLHRLTPRQRQVAQLVAKGHSNKAIASALGISVATVKDHVHAILKRLDLSSRVALITSARSG